MCFAPAMPRKTLIGTKEKVLWQAFKKYLNDKNVEIVLVSVDDMDNLKKLYPNYFLDTQEFVKLLDIIDKKLADHDKRFDAVDKRFDKMDDCFDLLARTAAEHTDRLDRLDEKLNNMATKDDISRVIDTLDAVVRYYKKKDEELAAQALNTRRLTDKVEEHDRDIRQMKPLLGLS